MPRSQTAWGIDVGTTSLKAIKLRREGENVVVEAFDVVEHDKFLTEPDVDKDEIIRHTLVKFLERNPIRNETVFIGVPGSSTFARFVKLPPVEPKKIPEIVRFEAIQQIPFDLELVNWDYQTFHSPDSPEVEVGIFAMKKDLVAQIMNNFQVNAMTVQGVQMAPLAVFNAVRYDGLDNGKGTVVLDIGADHTDLIFVDQGRLWMRTINIGGNHFTDALAKSFKVSFHKAEQLKRTAATNKYAKQIFQSMRPVFADLTAEVQRSIGFYNSGHRDSRLEQVIGMGNPFKLPNLQKYLQQNLQMDVIRLESFKRAAAEGKLAAGLNENILGLSAAYGLALQGLDMAAIDTNLLPTEIVRQMVWRQKRVWFAAAAACVVLGVGSLGLRLYGESKTVAAIPSDPSFIAAKGELAKAASWDSEFRGRSSTYDQKVKEIQSYTNMSADRRIWPELLQDIFRSLPQADEKQTGPDNRIIIKSIVPEYSVALSTVSTGSAAAAAGGPGTPAGRTFGGGGFPGAGGGFPGSMADRDRGMYRTPPGGVTGGGPLVLTPTPMMPTNPYGNLAMGAASATPGSTNPDDRGFLVVIEGYTPNADNGGGPRINSFIKNIVARAPKPAAPAGGRAAAAAAPTAGKRYYIELIEGRYEVWKVGTPTTAGGSAPLPWGTNLGPFKDVVLPDMLGQATSTAPATGAAAPPAGGGVAGAALVLNPVAPAANTAAIPGPVDPDIPGRSMADYQAFRTTLRVFIK